MSPNVLISVFWVSSLVLNCGLVAVLLGKGALRKFPFFATYAIFTLFSSGLCYLVRSLWAIDGGIYRYTFWSCEGIGVILGFAVVYEVFGKLLTPYPALRRLAFSIFQWSTLMLVLMGCLAVYAQSAAEHNKFMAAVMRVEEATRIIEVGLLMFLFVFSTAFGLHWRQCLFGMALGLGIFATVELVAITMQNYWGVSANHSFSMVRSIAFNISQMVWAGYLLAPEKETSLAETAPHKQLEQWNQVLTEFIYQ